MTQSTLFPSETLLSLGKLITRATAASLLRKAVGSKCGDKTVLRAVLTQKRIGGRDMLQLETFTADNKAYHKNFDPTADADALMCALAPFRQINLLCTVGECEYRRSSSGNEVLIGGEKLAGKLDAALSAPENTVPTMEISGNDRKKQYILSGNEPFLQYLGVSDKNGRVYDKKQAKFRQINRFLEELRDIIPALPAEGTLCVCDLCCGKSYLSFAIYHYLTAILGREVHMTGMDLKEDVIRFCEQTARALHYDGLHFLCGDIAACRPTEKVHLVVSLHACDTATDLVLGHAVSWQADVILSTPCCHHAMYQNIHCASLDFITDYGILKQKLCDAATDALRLKWLEANGYNVSALELIDPEDTPKNVLLRAVRQKKLDPNGRGAARARAEYAAAYTFLTGKEPPEGLL